MRHIIKLIAFIVLTFTAITVNPCNDLRDAASFVAIRDGNGGDKNLDAFGRDRVGLPNQIAAFKFVYDVESDNFSASTTGSGVVTHDATALNAVFATGPATGSVVYQTNKYFTYQPAKAQEISISATMGAVNTDVVKRIGYFDDSDGLYFQHDTVLSVCQRSKTSGTVVDTCIPQSQFNGNPMGGSADRRAIMASYDPSKSTIYTIELQWLGSGVVRFSMYNNRGRPILLHEFFNPGTNRDAYMRRGSLPLRYEISSGSGTTTTSELRVICSSIVSNGGEIPIENPFFQALPALHVSTDTAESHLLSLRLAETFGNSDNHTLIIPSEILASLSGGVGIVRVYKNSVLSGGTWIAVDSSSAAEYTTGATVTSKGRLLQQATLFGDTTGTGPNTRLDSSSGLLGLRSFAISRKNFNAESEYITITVQRSGSDNITVDAGIAWSESR